MTTMELDAARADIIRQLFEVESMDTIKALKRTLSRYLKREAAEETEYISKEKVLEGIRQGLKEMYEAKRTGNLIAQGRYSMNYSIKTIPPFLKELKRLGKKYHSIKQDYAKLLDELEANPSVGADLGGGIRKVRMTIGSENRGKSHGARVITFTYAVDEAEGIITLLFIYDKEERESISKAEIEQLLQEVSR